MTDTSGKPEFESKHNPSLIWGSMRIAERGWSENALSHFLGFLDQVGVTNHHVSNEYECFDLYARSFQKQSVQARHRTGIYCKLADPHFDETSFDAQRLTQKIDRYLKDLKAEQLQCVQWMWRRDPMDDVIRRNLLKGQADELLRAFEQLKVSGKVAEFGCFPYTLAFQADFQKLNLGNIQFNYLNLLETESIEDSRIDSNLIAIRPFAAGRLKKMQGFESQLEELNVPNRDTWQLSDYSLRFAACTPGVMGVILGLNSEEQTRRALEVIKTPDIPGEYSSLQRLASGLQNAASE